MYVNTQSLDAWEPEAAARGALEESPKKDLFDMSKLHTGGRLAQNLLQRVQAMPAGCPATCDSSGGARAG